MRDEVKHAVEGLHELAGEMRADRASRELQERHAQSERDRLLGIAERQAEALAGINRNVGALESDVRHAVAEQAGRSSAFADLRTWVVFALAVAAFVLAQVVDRFVMPGG